MKVLSFLLKFLFILFPLLLTACGGEESTSQTETSLSSTPAVAHSLDPNRKLGLTKSEASYFLNQTTFGPNIETINNFLVEDNYEVWLNEQIALPPSYQLVKVKELTRAMCADKDQNGLILKDTSQARFARNQTWWESILHEDDQLRHRVALALSQIIVVSTSLGLGLESSQYGVTSFYDVLLKHALGNYRDLLKEVSTHPTMGIFLTMVQSEKTDPETNVHPDENYAREILQLFTLGVHELNIDASLKLDNQGRPIPSYSQSNVEEFAKVFTGWNFNNANTWDFSINQSDRTLAMTPWEEYHDTSEKRLLNGETLPEGQTAEQDMDAALDNIFAQNNIGPFISKQLIQKLVKSNPSSDYIKRIATVFNDNGLGEKGDLAAVIKAIFLDIEARTPSLNQSAGKLKEPIMRFANLWRAFPLHASIRNGSFWNKEPCGQRDYQYYQYSYRTLGDYVRDSGQSINRARSVFSFYRPNHAPQGEIRNKGYVAPEFQIMTENNLVNTTNLLLSGIHYTVTIPPNLRTGDNKDNYAYLDISEAINRADNINELLSYLDILLLNQNMSAELNTILKSHLSSDKFAQNDQGLLEKARDAISLIITSPEYLIQP